MTLRPAVFLAVLFAALPATVREAAAQDTPAVIVRLRVDIARDVAQAIDESLREMARDLRESMRDLSSDLGAARRDRQASTRTTSRADFVDRQTQPLKLGSSGAVDLTTTGGKITVTAGSGSPTLEIVRRVRARTDADARQALTRTAFVIEDQGGRVRARTTDPITGQSSASIEVSFVATVPIGTQLHLATTGGDIAVTGVHGETYARTTGGDITLRDVGSVSLARTIGGSIAITDAQGDGDAAVHAIGGDVTLTRFRARQLSVDAVGGSITATDVAAREVSMSTSSGHLTFRGPMARDGHYDLHTHSGAIRFDPTGSIGFELDAHCYSGSITVDPALQLRTQTLSRRGVTGTAGSGEAVVVIVTFSGSVTVGASRRQ